MLKQCRRTLALLVYMLAVLVVSPAFSDEADFSVTLKKAQAGDIQAKFDLGCMYGTGNGVERNEKKAAMWFRNAAELGHAAAQYHLGACYENGFGVDKDSAQAEFWYHKAAEQEYIGPFIISLEVTNNTPSQDNDFHRDFGDSSALIKQSATKQDETEEIINRKNAIFIAWTLDRAVANIQANLYNLAYEHAKLASQFYISLCSEGVMYKISGTRYREIYEQFEAIKNLILNHTGKKNIEAEILDMIESLKIKIYKDALVLDGQIKADEPDEAGKRLYTEMENYASKPYPTSAQSFQNTWKESSMSFSKNSNTYSMPFSNNLCDICHGSGTCQVCHGKRQYYIGSYGFGPGTYVKCQGCNGDGKCEYCRGTGRKQ